MSQEFPDPRHQTGHQGETLAATYLRENGWRIVDRNVEAPFGELDLVISRMESIGPKKLRTIAFVEVKSRRDEIAPELNITPAKRDKITKLGRWFVMTREPGPASYRFDVVTVSFADNPPTVEHYPAAFDVRGRFN